MNKRILPNELAEMVAGLLVAPTLLGELDSNDTYRSFVRDIGAVVADYVGGDVILNDDLDEPVALLVEPNDSLPSLFQNAWAIYDASAWQGVEIPGVEQGTPLSVLAVDDLRCQLQSSLFREAQKTNRISGRLVDCEIQDWRIAEQCPDIPPEYEIAYRLQVEQSPCANQLFFQLYPKVLDSLSSEVVLAGLAGVIEVRNGKPAISLGIQGDDLGVHIESDACDGLFIHHDSLVSTEYQSKFFDSHDAAFDGRYYSLADHGELLSEARAELAELVFTSADFDGAVVTDADDWKVDGDQWSRTVQCKNPQGGDSLKGSLSFRFAEQSPFILDLVVSVPGNND